MTSRFTYLLTYLLTCLRCFNFLFVVRLCAGHVQPFSEGIQAAVPVLTQMTLDLYKTIVKELPPTPSKFHYLFNLRDLSRIYNGLCLTTPVKYVRVSYTPRVGKQAILLVSITSRNINRFCKKSFTARLGTKFATK